MSRNAVPAASWPARSGRTRLGFRPAAPTTDCPGTSYSDPRAARRSRHCPSPATALGRVLRTMEAQPAGSVRPEPQRLPRTPQGARGPCARRDGDAARPAWWRRSRRSPAGACPPPAPPRPRPGRGAGKASTGARSRPQIPHVGPVGHRRVAGPAPPAGIGFTGPEPMPLAARAPVARLGQGEWIGPGAGLARRGMHSMRHRQTRRRTASAIPSRHDTVDSVDTVPGLPPLRRYGVHCVNSVSLGREDGSERLGPAAHGGSPCSAGLTA